MLKRVKRAMRVAALALLPAAASAEIATTETQVAQSLSRACRESGQERLYTFMPANWRFYDVSYKPTDISTELNVAKFALVTLFDPKELIIYHCHNFTKKGSQKYQEENNIRLTEQEMRAAFAKVGDTPSTDDILFTYMLTKVLSEQLPNTKVRSKIVNTESGHLIEYSVAGLSDRLIPERTYLGLASQFSPYPLNDTLEAYEHMRWKSYPVPGDLVERLNRFDVVHIKVQSSL